MSVFPNLPVREDWNVGVVRDPIGAFLTPGFRPRVEWLPPLPAHSFRADPFALPARAGEALTMMFEQFDYRTGRGRLAAAIWRDGTAELHEVEGFPNDVHLSYPFLFEHAGALFCVPEMWQARRIGLYRAANYPRLWEPVTTLVENFPGVDSTVFFFGGRWWLACTHQDVDPFGRLWLWHAPAPDGPWQPHRRNPVKSDPRSSRPAGTPFWHDGHLYRPAQNDEGAYGRAVAILRIRRLDEQEFEEEPVCELWPDASWRWRDGLHTLSAAGAYTLIDAKKMGLRERASVARPAR